jgi:hypothetical protein
LGYSLAYLLGPDYETVSEVSVEQRSNVAWVAVLGIRYAIDQNVNSIY